MAPPAALAVDGGTPGSAVGPRAPREEGVQEAPKLVELPLRRSASGHVLIAVDLGSLGTGDFVLDTGASMSVITPATRDGLGIAADAGLVAEGRGAGGSLGEIRIVTIPRLRVGGRSYDGHTVAVMDLEHLAEKLGQPFAGILGRNFLERHILDVDFPAGQLRLWPPDAAVGGVDSLQQVGITRFEAGGLIRVEVVLDGKVTMPAVLDLGAGRSVIDWQAAAVGRGRIDDRDAGRHLRAGRGGRRELGSTRALRRRSSGVPDAGPREQARDGAGCRLSRATTRGGGLCGREAPPGERAPYSSHGMTARRRAG
jgi:hypothetical protein